MGEVDDNWLVSLINSKNPKCFRCGKKPGKKCVINYNRSGRQKISVHCEKCADIVKRQHDCDVEFEGEIV